jgi:PilZ domain-containing protein
MDQRRRTPRYAFVGGVAELTAPPSDQYLVASTGELGRFGCFVRTTNPFPAGAKVSLKITYDGKEFVAAGEVVYVLPDKGMGIVFRAIPPSDQSVLEDWLAQSTPSNM